MSRNRNRRIADAMGLRRVVVTADALNPDHPTVRILALDCGHRVRFASAETPRRLGCPTCNGKPVQQVDAIPDLDAALANAVKAALDPSAPMVRLAPGEVAGWIASLSMDDR